MHRLEVHCNFYLLDSHGHHWHLFDIFGSNKDLAGYIGSGIDTQLATDFVVVVNSATYFATVPTVAFPAVDGFDCRTEALPSGYGRVAIAVLHPEPHGRLERDGGVLAHLFWVVHPVEPNALPRCSIVVIPATIQQSVFASFTIIDQIGISVNIVSAVGFMIRTSSTGEAHVHGSSSHLHTAMCLNSDSILLEGFSH